MPRKISNRTSIQIIKTHPTHRTYNNPSIYIYIIPPKPKTQNLTMKFNVSALLLSIGATAVIAAPSAKRCECTSDISDKLVFTDDMKSFQASRDKKDPSCCDWSSDNCSASPDRPAGLDFVPSCQRHDFGYRNGKDQDRFTEEYRKKVDDNFRADLQEYCNQFDGAKRTGCKNVANVYYRAVRRCGDGSCIDSEDQEEIERYWGRWGNDNNNWNRWGRWGRWGNNDD